MDVFLVPTISFRLLYGLLIMGHDRRQQVPNPSKQRRGLVEGSKPGRGTMITGQLALAACAIAHEPRSCRPAKRDAAADGPLARIRARKPQRSAARSNASPYHQETAARPVFAEQVGDGHLELDFENLNADLARTD